MDVDLSVTSSRLQCTTTGCTYPPPLIQWLTQGQIASFPVNPSGTGGSCVLPEQLYTSTLDLQQNTTLSDNSDKVLIFSCRIEYPDSTMNLITSGSHTIRFAVRVTEAFLQQNNQNITSTLTVNSGEPVTLTCVTGTSRPAPNIVWYIGSWLIGSGTSLIFTPSNTDHNKVIYCQAYNTDPNLRVDSNKPSLFVKVRVTEVFLQQNNQNITSTLTVNSGEPVTLTCITGTSRPAPNIDWYIGSRSVGSGTSLTFTPSNTDHNEVIFCQAYNTDPSLKVASNKARLFVRVQVLTVTLEGSTGGNKVFNEGYPQTLKCNTSPSRPGPIIRWLLGNKAMIYNITSISMTGGDELYVLRSEITLVLMRNSSNQKIQCEGFISGQETSPVFTEVVVNVQYAPDVRVSIYGNTVVSSTAVLMCVPQGNPPQYTFHPWIHTVQQTEIRMLDGVNTVNNSTLTLSNISIQDTGRYTCTVDNGVPGLDRQVSQTGYKDVDVQGLPVFDKIQVPFAGELNNPANIEIRFYSYPPVQFVKFINQSDSSRLLNTSNIVIYMQPSNISMMFYEKRVTRLGHVAVLHFRNLTDTDFGNYTLQLSNGQGNVTLPFYLIVSAAPSVPKQFFFINIKDDHLVFGIEKGFNGGQEQTFIVKYQPVGMADGTWSIFMVSEDALEDPFTNGTYYLKIPIIPDGQYIFKVHAENKIGNSSSIEGVYVEIKTGSELEVQGGTNVAAIAGGIGAAVVVVVIIVVLFFIWKKKESMLKNSIGEGFNNSVQRRSNQTGSLYANTSYTGDVSNTGYESLQGCKTEVSPYQTLSSGNTKTSGKMKTNTD
ncbi:hypothetical protein ACJMK2_027524 [Sinanodonta woodiana]|uniref:Ig-like domain-containing protein n=1 Tax=Sinanodonta woodiana TaxID=1069815 RepID=A0ABD3XN59_SINWO